MCGGLVIGCRFWGGGGGVAKCKGAGLGVRWLSDKVLVYGCVVA